MAGTVAWLAKMFLDLDHMPAAPEIWGVIVTLICSWPAVSSFTTPMLLRVRVKVAGDLPLELPVSFRSACSWHIISAWA